MGDFDFLIGKFHVHNRRKNADGVWEEFPGVNVGARYLDGQAVIDELTATFPDGRTVQFVDVHVVDPSKGEWSNAIHAKGYAPDWTTYRGKFTDGVGVFYRELDGAHERHTWDRITGDSARFQQALSSDGVTWDTDWIMELTRIS